MLSLRLSVLFGKLRHAFKILLYQLIIRLCSGHYNRGSTRAPWLIHGFIAVGVLTGFGSGLLIYRLGFFSQVAKHTAHEPSQTNRPHL